MDSIQYVVLLCTIQNQVDSIQYVALLCTIQDQVDSIQYANHSARFLTGSRDGTARLWQYQRQQWKTLVFNANERLAK